jgi:outer membrane lipoprotein-sorting protein
MQRSRACILALVAAILPLPAMAAPGAPEILAAMDKTINGFEDQRMEVTMTVQDVGGSRKSYDFYTLQKGEKMRVVRFTSGEIKGMATLIQDRNRMYVYLPGFKKVRRIAAHNMNQSFAGSDYSNDDIASTEAAKLWDPVIDREDADHWYLSCTPKPGQKGEYAKAIFRIEKKRNLQMGIEYFDDAGKKIKSFDSSAVKDFGGTPRPTRIEVTDHRTGHKTFLDVHDFKYNQKLPDSQFTEQALEWGR